MMSALIGLLGVVVGSVMSVLSQFVPYWLNKKGKVMIFMRFVYSEANGKPWGIQMDSMNNKLSFRIPLWIEITNTKGIPKIIRNVSLYAYYKGKLVAEFTQIQRVNSNITGDAIKGNNEKYTFVISAYHSERYRLLYSASQEKLENKAIDEIRVSYYDDKNKLHENHLVNVPQPFEWKVKDLINPDGWIEIK